LGQNDENAGMTSFSAEILKQGANGFAGYAASSMLERLPDAKERFAPDPFTRWKTHLNQRILELSAAVEAGQEALFISRVIWSRKAFMAREMQESDLKVSLECLRDVLSEKLPGPALSDPLRYVDSAIKALDSEFRDDDEAQLNADDEFGKHGLRYLQSILEGDTAAAVTQIRELAANGTDLSDIYVSILLPAQREIGRLWHKGDVNVAEEHLVTATTHRTMSVLMQDSSPHKGSGKTVIAAAVANNAHDIGIRAIADMYQLAGWRTIYLGSDVPIQDLVEVVDFFNADILLLGATLSTQLSAAGKAIKAVREQCSDKVKIVVGGHAFDESPSLWEQVGADAYGGSVEEALEAGKRLTS
jgi:methanogenic corrinoid protein MtbC1